MSLFLQYIDTIWLPIALVVVHKNQRLVTLATITACMLMMRMQIEFITATGYPHGMLGLLGHHIFFRGMASYTLIYIGYITTAHLMPQNRGSMFLAASVTVFFVALFLSTVIMIL